MRLARGDLRGAQEDAERAVELARQAKDPQVLWPALACLARALVATDRARADAFVSELLSEWLGIGLRTGSEAEWSTDVAVALAALGQCDRVRARRRGAVGRSRLAAAAAELDSPAAAVGPVLDAAAEHGMSLDPSRREYARRDRSARAARADRDHGTIAAQVVDARA